MFLAAVQWVGGEMETKLFYNFGLRAAQTGCLHLMMDVLFSPDTGDNPKTLCYNLVSTIYHFPKLFKGKTEGTYTTHHDSMCSQNAIIKPFPHRLHDKLLNFSC